MRTVVHLSDLHFGRADAEVAAAVASCVRDLRPDVVAISGDLTQRARTAQFLEAREFLSQLPEPQVVVPGNHDVPLYNVAARVLVPLRGYTRHVTADLQPMHADGEVAVIGADTTRSLTVKHGGLSRRELRRVEGLLDGLARDVVKIVVCHHPFDTPHPPVWLRRQGRGAAALGSLVRHGADVFLTGHLHVSYTGHTAGRYRAAGRSAIVIEAGTATSVRQRGEVNAFNVLRIDGDRVTVERLEWQRTAGTFVPSDTQAFVRAGDAGWQTLPPT